VHDVEQFVTSTKGDIMRKIFIGLILSLVVLPVWAQTVPPEDQAALAATWQGTWTRPGYVYQAELHLTVKPAERYRRQHPLDAAPNAARR
jgi:hypothetical protein